MSSSADSGDLQLAINVMKELYVPEENLIFSPYSLVTALVMVLLGVSGNTQQQLVKTVFGSSSDDDVDEHLSRFIKAAGQIRERNQRAMKVANMLYADERFKLDDKYLKALSNDFKAITKRVHFRNVKSTLKTINRDISWATSGLISELFNFIDPDTVLVLVNAIYFMGHWTLPFDARNTDLEGTFYLSSGLVVTTPLMSHKEQFAYCFLDDRLQAIKLDYRDSGLSMVVMLPLEGVSLHAFIRRNFSGSINQAIDCLAKARKVKVELLLPRFKLSSTHHLVDTLNELGIEDIFQSDRANFSGITAEKGISVSDIVQKVTIEVNEKGTKAAAATGISVEMFLMSTSPKTLTFTANRPFLFAIINSAGRQILFLGAVHDPTKEN